MANSRAAIAVDADPLLGDVGLNWRWMLALGLLYLILGLAGLAMLFGLTIVSIAFIGVLLVVGGTAQLFECLKCKGFKAILWQMAIGALYIAAGIVVIYNTELATQLLAWVVGGVLAAVGVTRILMARQLRQRGAGWVWTLLSGILSIALAAMMVGQWPVPGLFFIALFIAIELLLQGTNAITLALTARGATSV